MCSADSGCTRSIEIFAASCSGCISLSRQIDLPLACLRASADADAAIDAMGDADHGGAALWPDSFQPVEPQSGWRDWHLLPFGAREGLPSGIRFERGRLGVDLPAQVATVQFEAALHAELGRFRYDAVTTSPAWLMARSEAGRPLLALPRYSLADASDFRVGFVKVEDLFVLEPQAHAGLVARLASRALARAISTANEDVRDGR